MTRGTFYAVGVGPGDPELLTVKAINTIKSCPVIAVPKSGASENIALKIAGSYITDKELLECEMPMIKDKAELDKYHDLAAEKIGAVLDRGKDVAFSDSGRSRRLQHGYVCSQKTDRERIRYGYGAGNSVFLRGGGKSEYFIMRTGRNASHRARHL